MNPTLQRAVTSFYNLVYEAQTFATTMSRIDTAEQEHYAGRIEGLNWVLDRCQETGGPFGGRGSMTSNALVTSRDTLPIDTSISIVILDRLCPSHR